MERARRASTIAWAAVLVAAGAACVGPSRTDDDYRRKAAESAQAMASAVETARLATELAARGRAPPPYVSVVMQESESAGHSIATGFGVVQPPTDRARRLRRDALDLFGRVNAVLGELRIAAYRGELGDLPRIAEPLERLGGELRRLMEPAPT